MEDKEDMDHGDGEHGEDGRWKDGRMGDWTDVMGDGMETMDRWR